jgi:hypothetical protein
MKRYEINAMFREGKDGTVYGLTLVDNRKFTVFNGSDLGKGYSGQALLKRFDMPQALERTVEMERQAIPDYHTELPNLPFHDLSLTHWVQDIAKEFLNVTKTERFHQDPVNPLLKRTKKKPRRPSW